MDNKEQDLLQSLSRLLNEPATRYTVELLMEYQSRCFERMAACSVDEFPALQGELRAYRKLIARLTKPLGAQK